MTTAHGVHQEEVSLFVSPGLHYDVILGMPWLQKHGPHIDWTNTSITFKSDHCRSVCLQSNNGYPISLDLEAKMSAKKPHSPKAIPATPIPINAAAFSLLAAKPDHQVFSVSLRDIEQALKPKKCVDPPTVLPPQYHEFLDIFSKDDTDKLPPLRPGVDHEIKMEPGIQAPSGPLYGMSREELEVLKKYLTENLNKGFIRASSSPAAAPVLFVKKPGGGLRFCVDYRALNTITIKNRYPLLLIQEMLDQLCKAVWYTKLDIVGAFNHIWMKEGEEWKTAFRTRSGLYKYLVMPFGLANAPSTFQNYINDVLGPDILDVFGTAYVDDILVYSQTLEEHRNHVKLVLRRLRDASLQVDISKCNFEVHQVKYLGLIIQSATEDGQPGSVSMDPAKTDAIKEWKPPASLKEVQSFIAFANFYRRFIKDFAKLASPLTALTKKNVAFKWEMPEQHAFESIKEAFSTALILQHFDPEKECVVETDASDYVSSAVLSQPDHKGVLRPVAFLSCRHLPAECNYKIYDKELLAIVRAFEEW